MVDVVTVSITKGGLGGVNAAANHQTMDLPPTSSTTKRVIEWDKAKDDMEAIKLISRIAIFLSRIRGNTYAYETRAGGAKLSTTTNNNDHVDESLENNNNSPSYEYSYEQPIIENPSRANIVLYNIARAHAFEIHGRNYITLEDIPIIIKIALSTANRNRVSILKLLLTAKQRADNGGHYEHKRKFFTSELTEALKMSKSTARRVMKELQVLGLVSIGKETRNGGDNDYIQLLEEFDWLLQKQFQDLIKGFDLEEVEEEQEQTTSAITKPIYRAYPSSDIWKCRNCKLKGDIHFMDNHNCSN
jgi:predicted transcriptional regulator